MVDASDDAKVQLVLAGATIHNESGPAIYAKNADKCFVTLVDGTQNSLSDGTDYTLEDDSDEPYATLFCRCDLTINGTGNSQRDGELSPRHLLEGRLGRYGRHPERDGGGGLPARPRLREDC